MNDAEEPQERGWERVERVFLAASDLTDPSARSAYLDEACRGDAELRLEVERLLAVAEPGDRFLEPPPLVAADLAGRVIDDFEVVEEIGRGGMGVVYRARQRSLGRDVALKVLPLVLRANDAVAERFRREAIAASKLRHPGIASVFAFGEVDGTWYYAMELVDGPSLREAMDRVWRGARAESDPDLADPRVAAEVVRQLAEALDYAHGQGVVHRDVKPQNVLVERDGRVRLIDFGVAKLLDLRGLTLSGDLHGTPHYMSPEQADARSRPVDGRADVYSAGAVLYELLSRRTPVSGSTSIEVLYRIAHDEVPALRSVAPGAPRDLEVLCQRALEKDPDDRLPSARVLADELARFLGGEPIATRPRGLAERLRRLFLRRRTVLVASVVGAAAGAAAIYGAAVPTRPRRAPFVARVVALDGEGGEVFAQELDDGPGRFTAPRRVGELPPGGALEVPLPHGRHRLTVLGDGGRFCEVDAWSFAGDRTVELFARLVDRVEPRPNGTPAPGLDGLDLVHCAPPERDVPIERIVGAKALARVSVARTAPVGPLLVARALVSNGDQTRFLAERTDQDDSPQRVNVFASTRERLGDAAWAERPLTWLDVERAQRLLAWYGLRLPTSAEAWHLTVGVWPEARAAVADPTLGLVVGRTNPSATAVTTRDFADHTVSVREGAPSGPLGLHHPLGNVGLRVLSPAANFTADRPWWSSEWLASLNVDWALAPADLDDADRLWGATYMGEGFVTLGLRGVRSLAPST